MAFYTRLDPSKYHICRNCHVGNNIEKENLKTGIPNNSKLCPICEDLKGKGDCEPGVPTPAQ